MTELSEKRPVFRNINVFRDVIGYRLPAAGIVSILHRISGLVMFLLLPFIIWMFDASVSSELSFARFTDMFNVGFGGFVLKLVALALLWALLHHFFAGLRHLRMDVDPAAAGKEDGRITAIATLALSLGLTVILGAKLFGLY